MEGLAEADFEEEVFVEVQHHSEWVVQDLQEPLLEELEQGEVIRSQMTAEKEVATQPAVDVIDYGTGADRSATRKSNISRRVA